MCGNNQRLAFGEIDKAVSNAVCCLMIKVSCRLICEDNVCILIDRNACQSQPERFTARETGAIFANNACASNARDMAKRHLLNDSLRFLGISVTA